MPKNKTAKTIKHAAQPRFAHAFFCDDIRYEIGNKVSLMGVYSKDLIFPALPAFLSRLGVVLTIDTAINEPIESIKVVIEKDTETLIELTPERLHQDLQSEGELSENHDEPTRLSFYMHIMLNPMTITSACMLRVRATIDGTEYMAGKIRISAQDLSKLVKN